MSLGLKVGMGCGDVWVTITLQTGWGGTPGAPQSHRR